MPTKTIELTKLKHDVDLLKSAVLWFIGRDLEGEYKPGFVRKLLRLSKEPAIYEFDTVKDFMKDLQKRKHD